MTERRPLVTIAGQVQELPVGDSLPGAGGVVAPVATRIYRATNQSIATGAGWTDMSWSDAAYEANGEFWTSGPTVTIPEDGYYQVFSEATFDGTGLIAPATANMQIIANGSTVIGDDEKQILVSGKAAMWAMAQRFFSAGATIKVQVKHSDAGSVNILAQGDHSPDFIVTKLTGAKGDPGAGGATGGTAVLDFGTGTGAGVATVAVTGQAGIGTGSRVRVWFMAATTADHNADEHGLIFPSRVGLSAGNIVAGVGFTIYAETELQLTGDVSVCWEWS